MSTLWIVHRDARKRAALARAAAAQETAVSGGPGDPLFDSALPADIVLLGLAGDLEAELEFAHRIAARLPDARWVLIAERNDAALARELFDAIDVELLSYPPDARTLRTRLRDTRTVSDRLPLSMRPARDLLAQRFSRWFADLEFPELLQALDPHLGDAPLVISGEEGTGRGLLARYVHGFGRNDPSRFAHIVCTESMPGAQLRDAIRDAAGEIDAAQRCTLWLDAADRISIPAQRQLADWIEFGPPVGTLRCRVARWIATVGDAPEPGGGLAIDAALRDALSGISIRIPSVRERPHRIASFANDTARAWCAARRQNPRRFGEDAIAVLEEYPWAGNLRELEAVVRQTLAAGAADPIRADDLQYDGTAFAPINAGEVGVLLDNPIDNIDNIDNSDLQAFDQFDPTAQPGLSEPRPASGLGMDRDRELPPEPRRELEVEAEAEVEAEPANAGPSPGREPPGLGVQRLVGAIAHEIRNPLSTIRTFTELLPNRYDDPEFRDTFTELVGRDARRLESVVSGLTGLAALSRPHPVPVDIARLVEELLEQRRDRAHARKLLVLRELNPGDPPALVDEAQIRIAMDSILDKTIELAPERGEVYVATRHHPAGLRGAPAIRVLIRFGSRAGPAESAGPLSRAPRIAGVSVAENALPFAIAEAIVLGQAGAFEIDVAENDETVVLLDLPTTIG